MTSEIFQELCRRYDYPGNSKCCKVIVTSFCNRPEVNNSPSTPENVLKFLRIHIENEINIDHGVDLDIIIVNNDTGYEPGKLYLRYIHNTYLKKNNGRIICLERPNFGESYGGYNFAYEKFRYQYKYWFFCEDDVILFKPKYYKDCIDSLKSRKNLSAIAIMPIRETEDHQKFVGGGILCTSSATLSKIYKMEGQLPNYNGPSEKSREISIETKFSKPFYENGFVIEHLPKISPLAQNWQLIRAQRSIVENRLHQRKDMTDYFGEYIYQHGPFIGEI